MRNFTQMPGQLRQTCEDRTAPGLETTCEITGITDHPSREGGKVDGRSGGEAGGEEDHARCDCAFDYGLGFGVLSQKRIDCSVADLVAKLVGMSLGHRFRCEDHVGWHQDVVLRVRVWSATR